MITEREDSNAILARWAHQALKEYDRVSGGGTTEEGLIPLLIASLLHLATYRDLDATRVAKEAVELFDSERFTFIEIAEE